MQRALEKGKYFEVTLKHEAAKRLNIARERVLVLVETDSTCRVIQMKGIKDPKISISDIESVQTETGPS